MGFEPTRAEHIGLAVQRLNHSATSSCYQETLDDTNYRHPELVAETSKLLTSSLVRHHYEHYVGWYS